MRRLEGALSSFSLSFSHVLREERRERDKRGQARSEGTRPREGSDTRQQGTKQNDRGRQKTQTTSKQRGRRGKAAAEDKKTNNRTGTTDRTSRYKKRHTR